MLQDNVQLAQYRRNGNRDFMEHAQSTLRLKRPRLRIAREVFVLIESLDYL